MLSSRCVLLHTVTLIPSKIYFSELKEYFINTLCEEVWILPWPVRNRVISNPSFAVFSGLFAFIGSASEQGQLKCLSAGRPVLPVSVSVATFTHLSWTSWVSCRLSHPFASASGKVWCQAVCAGWSALHSQLKPRPCFITEQVYGERTAEMAFYKSSLLIAFLI